MYQIDIFFQLGVVYMLSFSCSSEKKQEIIDFLVEGIYDITKSTELKSLAFDFFDDDLKEAIYGVIEETEDGFDFDVNDEIGEEPYGYVSIFFESFLNLLEKVKEMYNEVGIDGYFFMNEIGCSEYVLRQRVYTTKEMDSVEFVDQLQCVMCLEWVDAKDAHKELMEDDLEYGINSEEFVYPSGYHSGEETMGEYCFCSKECEEKYYGE